MLGSFRAAVQKARREPSLYFAPLLSAETILQAFGDARLLWQGWIDTPATTVWVFLSQCLSMDHSCREAVARFIAWRVDRGLRSCSADTGAYCTAREDLPESACRQLVRQTGAALESEAPASWRWHGRHVRVVDGSTITMPDTAANQAEYPQLALQKPGCGFPIARIVVVFSLAVGTVLEAAIGKYEGKQTGENSLLRTLYESLEHLRCKTPHRVRNEFLMHLVGYNLIRRAMALAAFESGSCPWQVSFKGTLQTLNAFLPVLRSSASLDAWCDALIAAIAAHAVGDRPDRYEPRRVKRRPKPYKWFHKPRPEYKRRAA